MSAMNTAVIGTGVIGAAWASAFLTAGYDVTAWDPAEGAEERLRDQVAKNLAVTDRLRDGTVETPPRGVLRFVETLADAVAGASFIQESGPERLDLKQELLAQIDAAAPAEALIASSTSGFGPSSLAASATAHPGRIVVGHPFNPAHLVPLVELVPGRDTPADAVDRGLAFYREVGKKPILVRAELPGHVTNRLQAALWQEAYSLVQRGVASVADIDTAIAYGPGLRWSVLGPLALQHLSGGPGGMRHLLEHLGPPQEVWMHDLQKVHLDDGLTDTLVAGVDAELDGRDPAAMAEQRDEILVRLLALKAEFPDLR
jgi:3-hydroxyacyl-CoA dehydrogenase